MLGLPRETRTVNYPVAWKRVRAYIFNSIFMSGVSVLAVMFLASYTGFIFARYRFRGKEWLFYAVIAVMMIPRELVLVPLFVIVRDLKLLDTYWACIIPWTAGGQALGIFIMRTFIASLPEELFEAARIDGASNFQLYTKIAFPLSYPGAIAVAIMHFVNTWNDIIWPLVSITEEQIKPVSIGLVTLQTAMGSHYPNYGPLFAGYVLSSLPLVILFLFTMKYYIRGLLAGAVKM
jgi:ABC-type glycerol-3-phosphate transport system permease component